MQNSKFAAAIGIMFVAGVFSSAFVYAQNRTTPARAKSGTVSTASPQSGAVSAWSSGSSQVWSSTSTATIATIPQAVTADACLSQNGCPVTTEWRGNRCWVDQNGAVACSDGNVFNQPTWGAAATAGSGWNDTPRERRKDDGKGVTLQQVKATAAVVREADIPPASYIKLAKSIEFDGAAVDEAKLVDLLHRHFIKIYDFAKVDDYLFRQAQRQGANARWVWKPMRTKDNTILAGTSSKFWNTPPGVGFVLNEIYAHKIPGRVLETASCILSELPDALLLVSDYAVIKPDPFLAVTTKKLLEAGKVWIVDVWDEPSFVDNGPSAVRVQ